MAKDATEIPKEKPSTTMPPNETTETTSFHNLHLPSSLIFPYMFLLRLFNAFTSATFFQPDEFFQSLEPAHFRHYGYGTLTWEWQIGLRSYLHPLMYDLIWYCGDLLKLEELGVIYLPKFLNALIAAIGEVALYHFVYSLSGKNEKVARFALLVSVSGVWNWFTITRSFGNSIEMNLTCLALSLWPFEDLKKKRINWWKIRWSLALACFCCIIRPTNGLIWMVLALGLLRNLGPMKGTKFILNALLTAFACLSLNTVVDYWFYGELTFPLWNFLKFNALTPLSQFYGKNDWHFHLSQSLPVIMMLFLPFFMLGFFTIKSYNMLKMVIVTNILMFSLIKHKEFRFLYPLQPFFIFFIALGLQKFQIFYSRYFKVIIPMILILNTIFSVYLTQYHERGVIDVMNFIREDAFDIQSVGFLTPCHSTPNQSLLHNPELPIWSLTCEPPLHLLHNSNLTNNEIIQELSQYEDQSDKFYSNQETWLFQNLPPIPFSITSHPFHSQRKLRQPGREYTYEWPSHLVFFESLEKEIQLYLKGSLYEECARFKNTEWHWDDRRAGDIIIWCLPHFY